MPRNAYKYDTEVNAEGRVELTVPIPKGTRVEVLIITHDSFEGFEDLVDAAKSSTEFWDNPIDDAEWNNA